MYRYRFLAAALIFIALSIGTGGAYGQSSAESVASRMAVADECAAEHRWADAVAAYESVIALDSHRADVFNGLGEAQLALDRPKDARRAFKRATQLEPNNPTAHYNLGVALTRLHHYQQAVDAYWNAVSAAPEDARARFALAESYLKVGKSDLALLQHDRLKELDQKLAAQLFDDIYFRKADNSTMVAPSPER